MPRQRSPGGTPYHGARGFRREHHSGRLIHSPYADPLLNNRVLPPIPNVTPVPVNGARAVQTAVAGGGYGNVTGAAGLPVTIVAPRYLVLLTVSDFATAVGAIVNYRLLKDTGAVVLAGGAIWNFFFNVAAQHLSHTFFDVQALPLGTYNVSVQWQATTQNVQSDAQDVVGLALIPVT